MGEVSNELRNEFGILICSFVKELKQKVERSQSEKRRKNRVFSIWYWDGKENRVSSMRFPIRFDLFLIEFWNTFEITCPTCRKVRVGGKSQVQRPGRSREPHLSQNGYVWFPGSSWSFKIIWNPDSSALEKRICCLTHLAGKWTFSRATVPNVFPILK